MYSCCKVTALLDKQLFEKLSLMERVNLFFHTRMCDACSAYEKQTAIIHKALKKNPAPLHYSSADNSSFKENVKQNLKQ